MLKRNARIVVTLAVMLCLVMGMHAMAQEVSTYVGTASGYGGSVRVSIEVQDGKLLNLTATGAGETDGIGTVAVEDMAKAMLEKGTWDVDTVTGATMTSDAMRQAAKKAMDEAGLLEEAKTYVGTASGYGGSVRVSIEVRDGKLLNLTATGAGETDGIGTVAVEDMAKAMLEKGTWDVDTVTGATMTSDAMRQAAKKAMDEAALLEEAKTYVGTASGYGGSVRVSIEVKGGELLNLTATGAGETDGIGTVAVEDMAKAMLEKGTWDVDVVTGATMTSDAMRQAAKKAMDEAGLVP